MSIVSNADLVREGLAAWRRGDIERALTMAHPEIVSVRAAPLPDPQTYHGHAGILQMYADWTTDFSEFEMYPDEIEEVGEQVLVHMIQRGTGKASGAEVVGRFWFLYTFNADGLAVRQEAYATREQALRVAGA
jgi:ketosteroid isomerase-like protein